jgi:hypothetical protein
VTFPGNNRPKILGIIPDLEKGKAGDFARLSRKANS